MAHLLIAGINYAPEVTGIAPYTAGMAERLAARGHRVTVLTGMPHYPQWSVFEGYRGRLSQREVVGGVEIHRIRHYVPNRQSAWRRAAYEASFLLHALRAPWLSRPDVVLGIVPSVSGGTLARLLSHWFHVPYGLLFQDLVGRAADQSGIDGAQRVAGLVRRIELSLARDAAAVAIIAEGFRSYFTDAGVPAERIFRVRNWTHLTPAQAPRAAVRAGLGWKDGELIVLHAGNMGYKQGLENVLHAAAIAQAAAPARGSTTAPVRFVLQGDGNQRAEIEAQAQRLNLGNLSFLPLAPAEEFPSILAAADLLLVNQRGSVRDMSLPGKLTSYFAAGVPVVAAVAPESETARELELAGAGVALETDQPALLLETIISLGADAERRRGLGAAGKRYAERYLGEENAIQGINQFIDDILGSARTAQSRNQRYARGG